MNYCRTNSCSREEAINFFIRYEATLEPQTVREKRNLYKMLDKEFYYWASVQEKVTPALVKFQQQDVIFCNTINVIAGGFAVHKSRLGHGILSSALAPNRKINQLEIECLTPQPVVILIDTEHNTGQLAGIRKRILRNAGLTQEVSPDNFLVISLKEVANKESRLQQIFEYLDSRFPDRTKIVMIDTVTDVIGDVNNLEKSMDLIQVLNSNLDRFNLTFICVIHEIFANGRPKPRGHVGSEIQNKSSTTIRISKAAKQEFKIEFQKLRNGALPAPAVVTFCDQSEGLKLSLTETSDVNGPGRRSAFTQQQLFDALRCLMDGPRLKKELVEQLCIQLECSDRTIKDHLKVLKTVRIDGLEYNLLQRKVAGKAEYMLETL